MGHTSLKIDYNAIDVVDSITRKEFEENYFKPQRPVVLRGLLKDDPAHQKWSFEYFKNEMGDMEVGIFDASMDKVERSFKEPHYHMKFRDYLEEIERGPTKKRLFLFNPFKHKPELMDDFEFPKLCNGFLKSLPFLFFGGDGSVTRAHQDMDMSCVFLTQFTGKKRVVLIDPKYSTLLYRFPLNVHTAVNIDHPDFNSYPGLKYVEGQEVVLEFGDTLFMPSGWWHHIEYLGSGFSMSMRCLSPNIKDIAHGALNVGLKTHIDDLLVKFVGQDWVEYKKRKAISRANESIRKLETALVV